jgi:hypothetical protein
MWCRICGQDVPGIPSIEEGSYSCARCGQEVGPILRDSVTFAAKTSTATDCDADNAGVAGTAAQRPPIYDGWEIDEQLRHFRRILGPPQVAWEQRHPASAQPKFRLDAGHGLPGPHRKRARKSPKKTRRAAARVKLRAPGDGFLSFLAWMSLSLGTMGSTCGLALLGQSISAGRQDLWSIGGPIALAGQIALVLGLLLQLDRIWRGNRWASAAGGMVDEQSDAPTTAADSTGPPYGSTSAFYTHWSGGAGPEILLGDLKSQLDLLSAKLASH